MKNKTAMKEPKPHVSKILRIDNEKISVKKYFEQDG